MNAVIDQSLCPFCHPSVSASVFYTHGEFLSLYNIAPVLPGHSLVIPRNHVISILDLTHDQLSDFFTAAKETTRILMKVFRTDSFNWSLQEKYYAGQTVEHLHLHIVPRIKGDLENPGDWYPLVQDNDISIIDSLNRPKLKKNELRKIITSLKKAAD